MGIERMTCLPAKELVSSTYVSLRITPADFRNHYDLWQQQVLTDTLCLIKNIRREALAKVV